MSRLTVALAVAVGLHVLLMIIPFKKEQTAAKIWPLANHMTITMSYRKPAPVDLVKNAPPVIIPKDPVIKTKVAKAIVKPPILKKKQILSAPPEPKRLPTPRPIKQVQKIQKSRQIPIYEPNNTFIKETTDAPNQIPSRQNNTLIDRETAQAEDIPKVLSKAEPLYDINPPPKYPRLARRRGWQGTVLLDVFVSQDGTAKEVRVQTGSGYAILDKASITSVKDWRFTPGQENGHPLAMWVQVPIRFALQ